MKLSKKLKYILLLIVISNLIFSEEETEKINQNSNEEIVSPKNETNNYGKFDIIGKYVAKLMRNND